MDCFVKIKTDWVKAEFIGVYQFSNVIDPSPFVGGHPGGVIAYPLVVVKVGGRLKEVSTSNVKFEQ